MPAWGKAKRGNDFASFAPYLEKIVESLRAQPTILPLTATRMKSGWTAMNTA